MFSPKQLNQAINPWSWWFGNEGNQVGLVNVNQYRSGNPDLEQKIVAEVAGYGMQLNIIEQALAVLTAHMKRTTLSAEEQACLERFDAMLDQINAAKAQAAMDQLAHGGVEALMTQLHRLKETHPDQFQDVARRLREIL